MKREIKKILQNFGIFPKKSLGQRFLINEKIDEIVVSALDLSEKDIVVEVGAGLGFLTEKLAERAGKVIAVEKDEKLCQILKERLKEKSNIEIKTGDILKFSPKKEGLFPKKYKLTGNLPFSIASYVIRKFLEEETPPKLAVVMVQKEVAFRICAKPPKMNLLALAVQLHSTPKIVKIVKNYNFWPKPKVDSAILKLEDIQKEKVTSKERELFFKIAKIAFSSPRKKIKNNLKKLWGEKTEEILKKGNIDPEVRASEISVKEWKSFISFLANFYEFQKISS